MILPVPVAKPQRFPRKTNSENNPPRHRRCLEIHGQAKKTSQFLGGWKLQAVGKLVGGFSHKFEKY